MMPSLLPLSRTYLFSLLLDCDGKPEFSRVEIQNFIKNGAVKVNNNVVLKPSCKVKDSDKVDIDKNVIDNSYVCYDI